MKRTKSSYIRDLVFAAMFLAMGMTLPFLTAQIKEIGDSLLPMHIPVMLCGLICGAKYGFAVGITLPFLRSICFGMPPLYPNAVWMALELCTYGFVIGAVFFLLRNKSVASVYISLIMAMILGRVVWGISKAVLLGIGGDVFTLHAFWIGGFADALPGIILQLILVPFIMASVFKYQRRAFRNKIKKEQENWGKTE